MRAKENPDTKTCLQVWTPEQYHRVLENIKSQYLRDAWVIGWHTGMRINNVLRLTWDRVYLFGRWITLEVAHRRKKVPSKVWNNDTL